MLTDLHQNPIGRTLGKIQEHLSSIYRVYLRDGTLELVFKGEPLSYPTPPILNAPYFKTPNAKAVTWRKDIDFDFGDGLRAHGFAALFEVASTARAGFALFRRNRLIEGSSDEGYRPHAIFGNPNDYTFQRVFGELHLEGFEVSHTKDGFRWHDNEDAFLQLLQEELDRDPLPVLKQAEGHRVRPKAEDFVKGAEKANQRTTETIQKCVPQVIQKQHELGPEKKPVPAALPQAQQTASTREIEVDVNGIKWLIRIELSTDPAIGDWLSVSDVAKNTAKPKDRRLLCLRLSLNHEENVRSQLQAHVATGRPLSEWRRMFFLDRSLQPTRRSVLALNHEYLIASEWFYPRAPQFTVTSLTYNQGIVQAFVGSLQFAPTDGHGERTTNEQHGYARISASDLYEVFLTQIQFANPADSQQFTGLLLQIREFLDRNPTAPANVYLMAWSPGAGQRSRQRTLDKDSEIGTSGAFFSGASMETRRFRRAEVYPGDREVKITDELSIQIHILELLERESQAVIAQGVPAIAVWMPAGMGTDTLVQDLPT